MMIQAIQVYKYVFVNLYLLRLERLKVELIEHVLVDGRSHHATKKKGQLQKVEQSAHPPLTIRTKHGCS